MNVALGGIGFLAVCGGLLLLTTFIAALTALITQLITLAAVIFGGWIAVQIFSATGGGRDHGQHPQGRDQAQPLLRLTEPHPATAHRAHRLVAPA